MSDGKPIGLSVALRSGSRDTALLAGFFLLTLVLNEIRRGHDIALPTAHTMVLALVVLCVTWVAIVIACRLGASTLTSFVHQRGKNRIPDTFAVFVITSFVTAIVLLLMGLVE